jgi:hypothetical protein
MVIDSFERLTSKSRTRRRHRSLLRAVFDGNGRHQGLAYHRHKLDVQPAIVNLDVWKHEAHRYIVPGGRPDVIIVEHQYALDPYIEDSLALRLEVDLGKVLKIDTLVLTAAEPLAAAMPQPKT